MSLQVRSWLQLASVRQGDSLSQDSSFSNYLKPLLSVDTTAGFVVYTTADCGELAVKLATQSKHVARGVLALQGAQRMAPHSLYSYGLYSSGHNVWLPTASMPHGRLQLSADLLTCV